MTALFFPRKLPRLGTLICLALILGSVAEARAPLDITWTNGFLTISAPHLPGGSIQVWYLEAFCRSGSTDRDWSLTTIPHATRLLRSDRTRRRLFLETRVEPSIVIEHEIRATEDEVEFRLSLRNHGSAGVDVQWFQPCIRVAKFTGETQATYPRRSFLFTDKGLVRLDALERTEEARYRGGQVYAPPGINPNDLNPRPISRTTPANGLIGCFSADNRYLMATAWSQTHELFQGVIVCLHNDPHVGGLNPGQTKRLRGKIYLMENDPEALLKRYRRDVSTWKRSVGGRTQFTP